MDDDIVSILRQGAYNDRLDDVIMKRAAEEITRLRAELEQERIMHAKALEGETLLRLDVIKDNDRLRAELDGLRTEHDSVVRGWQSYEKRTTAAARRDTEEIARLRDALEKITALDGWAEDWGDTAKDIASAALASRSPDGKGE
jgi:uncharacterized protein with von Willebrand factor type A (vWA) domain